MKPYAMVYGWFVTKAHQRYNNKNEKGGVKIVLKQTKDKRWSYTSMYSNFSYFRGCVCTN